MFIFLQLVCVYICSSKSLYLCDLSYVPPQVYVPLTLPAGCRWHDAAAAAAWTDGPSAQCWGRDAPWAQGRAWTSGPTVEQH